MTTPTDRLGLAWARWSQPVLQAVKAAVAAVSAWLLAAEVLALPQPFLAPYAAVFLFGATAYRSLHAAAEQVAAVALGAVLAAVVSAVMPTAVLAMGVAVLVGMLLGRWRLLGSSGIWVGVTALLLISYGSADDFGILLDRLAEIALGAAIGVVVNVVVFPPLAVRWPKDATAELAQALSGLLRGVATSVTDSEPPEKMRQWRDRAVDVERLILRAEEAQSLSDESALLNLRHKRQRDVVTHWKPSLSVFRRAWPHLRELTDAAVVTAHDDNPFASPAADDRSVLVDVLRSLADVIDERGRHHGSSSRALDAQQRADDGLRELRARLGDVAGEHHGRAIGLAALILPATKAADELRRLEPEAVHA